MELKERLVTEGHQAEEERIEKEGKLEQLEETISETLQLLSDAEGNLEKLQNYYNSQKQVTFSSGFEDQKCKLIVFIINSLRFNL